MVAPREASSPSAAVSASWLGRSTPAVGSSRKSSSGSPASARDQHPLLLASGELGDAVTCAVGEVDHLEGVLDRRTVGTRERAQQATAGEPAGGDDLPDGGRDAGGRAEALGHVADPLPVVKVAQVGAEELERAGGQRAQPGQGADQGGLARPVGAHECHELAGLDAQVDATQDRAAADGDRPVREVQGCHWHPLAFTSASRLAFIRDR